MKGLIPVTATQTPDGIFWSSQDQNYVPRLLNYLKIDYSDYEWETVPGYDLTPEKIAEYEAVAVTSMSQRYFPLIKQAKPSIQSNQNRRGRFHAANGTKGSGRWSNHWLCIGG